MNNLFEDSTKARLEAAGYRLDAGTADRPVRYWWLPPGQGEWKIPEWQALERLDASERQGGQDGKLSQ